MSEGLLALRNALACARKNADRITERFKALSVAFEAMPEVQAIRAELKQAKECEALNAAALREAILADFAATGDKAPLPGLGVLVISEEIIEDYDAALAWCKEHAPALLAINAAKATLFHAHVQEIPGVVTRQRAQATIAAKLPEE